MSTFGDLKIKELPVPGLDEVHNWTTNVYPRKVTTSTDVPPFTGGFRFGEVEGEGARRWIKLVKMSKWLLKTSF